MGGKKTALAGSQCHDFHLTSLHERWATAQETASNSLLIDKCSCSSRKTLSITVSMASPLRKVQMALLVLQWASQHLMEDTRVDSCNPKCCSSIQTKNVGRMAVLAPRRRNAWRSAGCQDRLSRFCRASTGNSAPRRIEEALSRLPLPAIARRGKRRRQVNKISRIACLSSFLVLSQHHSSTVLHPLCTARCILWSSCAY